MSKEEDSELRYDEYGEHFGEKGKATRQTQEQAQINAFFRARGSNGIGRFDILSGASGLSGGSSSLGGPRDTKISE